MEIEIKINPNELLAVALMAGAKSDPRAMLQGVNLEIKNNTAFIIASNGHNLAALELGGASYDDINFLIPAELIKNIKKSTKSDNKTISLIFNTDNKLITLIQSGQTFINKAVDADFPNWRRIIPAPFTPSFNFYQMHLMAVFEKAGKLLDSKPEFYHNGDNVPGGVHVRLSDDRVYMGLIMPIKLGIDTAAMFTPAYTE